MNAAIINTSVPSGLEKIITQSRRLKDHILTEDPRIFTQEVSDIISESTQAHGKIQKEYSWRSCLDNLKQIVITNNLLVKNNVFPLHGSIVEFLQLSKEFLKKNPRYGYMKEFLETTHVFLQFDPSLKKDITEVIELMLNPTSRYQSDSYMEIDQYITDLGIPELGEVQTILRSKVLGCPVPINSINPTWILQYLKYKNTLSYSQIDFVLYLTGKYDIEIQLPILRALFILIEDPADKRIMKIISIVPQGTEEFFYAEYAKKCGTTTYWTEEIPAHLWTEAFVWNYINRNQNSSPYIQHNLVLIALENPEIRSTRIVEKLFSIENSFNDCTIAYIKLLFQDPKDDNLWLEVLQRCKSLNLVFHIIQRRFNIPKGQMHGYVIECLANGSINMFTADRLGCNMSDPELIKQGRIGFQEGHIIHSSDRNDYGHESSLFIALKYPVIHNDDASMDGLFHKGLSEKDVRMLYLSKNVKLQEKFNQYILGKVKAGNIDYKWLESIGDCLSLALLTECINHKDLYKNETADICLSMFYIVLTQTKDVSLRKLAVKKIFEIQPDSIRATHFLVYTSTMKLILSDNSFKEYHSLASLLLKMSESVDTREHYYD